MAMPARNTWTPIGVHCTNEAARLGEAPDGVRLALPQEWRTAVADGTTHGPTVNVRKLFRGTARSTVSLRGQFFAGLARGEHEIRR